MVKRSPFKSCLIKSKPHGGQPQIGGVSISHRLTFIFKLLWKPWISKYLSSAGGIRYSVWVSIHSAPVCFYPITNRKWPDECSLREESISHRPPLAADLLVRFPPVVQLDALWFHIYAALMCSSRGQRVAFRRFCLPANRRARRASQRRPSHGRIGVLTEHHRLLLVASSPKLSCTLHS